MGYTSCRVLLKVVGSGGIAGTRAAFHVWAQPARQGGGVMNVDVLSVVVTTSTQKLDWAFA